MRIDVTCFCVFCYVMSRQHSQSRENINFPEDEVVGGSEGGIEEIGGSSSPGKMNKLLCPVFSYLI